MKNFIDFINTTGVEIARSIVVILIGYMLIKILVTLLKKAVNRNKLADKTMANFVIGMVHVILMVVLVIGVLSMFGITTENVVTFASVLSLGISLAMQDVLTSLANGIIVVTTKPFAEGEFVSIGGTDGTVVSITMFATRLKTANGQLVSVPNTVVASSNITNYSRLPIRRVCIDVPVGYGSKTEQVKEVIMGVVNKQEGVLKNPAPSCRLAEFGDSNLVFGVKCWVAGGIYWDTLFDLNEKILDALIDAKISIDYNQLDVHIKSTPNNGGELNA